MKSVVLALCVCVVLACEANAGIFFNRGGCANGQCSAPVAAPQAGPANTATRTVTTTRTTERRRLFGRLFGGCRRCG